MDFKILFAVVFTSVGLLAWDTALPETDDELYGDEGTRAYKEVPGSKWQEQALVLPAFPTEKDLIEVDLSLNNYPFTLWIDESSFSVGEDRVIRYTAVLRSESGAENVIYEGIRCIQQQVQTYAFGAAGRFREVQNPNWRYIRKGGQDRYRQALARSFFCPLPSGNAERQIKEKLKRPNPGFSLDDGW